MTEIETLLLSTFKEFLQRQEEVSAGLLRQLNAQSEQVNNLREQVNALAARLEDLIVRLPE